MVKDQSDMRQEASTDWDKAWDVVSQLSAARKQLEHDAVSVVTAPHAEDEPIAIETIRTETVQRPFAVWILIGALWISFGMIVSATIVAVAFLA